MKKTFLFIALIAIATMVGLNSCNKGDVAVDPQTDLAVTKVLPDALMPAFDAKTVDIYGSVDEDMTVYPELSGDRGEMGNMGNMHDGMNNRMNDRMHKRMGPGFAMRHLLHDLNLTDAQKETMFKLMLAYHDCVKSVMESTRAQRETILADAAAQRKAIIDAYKAGTDPNLKTRAQVVAALKDLNQKTREALQALIDTAALCNCYKTLLSDIYKALDTDAQKATFKAWYAKLTDPCLKDFDPTAGN